MSAHLAVRRDWQRLAALNALAFSLGFVTNTLEPALLGSRTLELAPEAKNTVVGLLTFAGLLVAVVWQPMVGDLSDRTSGRWGRRTPYFLAGSGLLVAALYLVALAPGLSWLFASVMLLQFASNTIQAPSQALLPDLVPAGRLGAASGWKSALEILAFVAGRQISARLVAAGQVTAAAGVAGFVVLIGLGVVLIVAPSTRRPGAPSGVPRPSPRRAFAFEARSAPGFSPWFINRALVWGGFIALNTFLLFFVIDVLGMSEAAAQRFVGDLATLMGLGLILVAVPAGRLADRLGGRPLILAAGLGAALGASLLVGAPSRTSALIAAGILGLAAGVFQVASWSMATRIVPGLEAGRMLGLANIATAAGSGLARLGGGVIIDPINRWAGSNTAGYLTLYALAAVAFLAGSVALMRSPGRRSR